MLPWLVCGFFLVATHFAVPVSSAFTTEGVYIVRFSGPFTDALLSNISSVTTYEVTDVVPPDGLLLYLTSNIATSLTSNFDTITSINLLSDEQRCAPQLETLVSETTETVFTKKRLFDDDAGTATLVTRQQIAQLRVILHAGAVALFDEVEIQTLVIESVMNATQDNCTSDIIDATTMHFGGISIEYLNETLTTLFEISYVCFVEPVYEPQLLNMWSSATAQDMSIVPDTSMTAADQCTECHPLWDAGVTGDGQLIAISDTGLASDVCHFVDGVSVPVSTSFSDIPTDTGHRRIRVIWTGSGGDTVDANGHGTHVCGTAVGVARTNASGVQADDFNGVAPGARVVFIDCQIGSGGLSIPTNLLEYAYNAGARVHSASWGIDDDRYSLEDIVYDRFDYEHRDFLNVFAVGNGGSVSSTLSPAMAKTVYAVGAALPGFAAFDIASSSNPNLPPDLYSFDWTADFSSRGGANSHVPWMKPDGLGSGGRYVWSADAHGTESCATLANVVAGLAGTSMACPQVAACAILIRHYFMGGYYFADTFVPFASLLRALLSVSGVATRGVFPSIAMSNFDGSSAYAPYKRGYIEGHGRVSIHSVIPTANATRIAILANENHVLLSTNHLHRYCVSLRNAGGGPIDVSVVLSYTDYYTAIVAAPTLVNNLDLRITTIDANNVESSVLHPNRLSTPDSSSPLEVTRFSLPSHATRIQIEVVATNIIWRTQDYSLAVLVRAPNTDIRTNDIPVTSLVSVALDGSIGGTCTVCASGAFTSNVCTTAPPTNSPAPTALPPTPTTAPPTPTTAPPTPTTAPPTPTAFPPSPTTAPPTPTVTPVGCVRHSSYAIMTMIDNGDIVPLGSDVVCCESFASVASESFTGEGSPDPMRQRLLREYVAAIINVRHGRVLIPSDAFKVANAQALLGETCSDGLVTIHDVELASSLTVSLILINSGCVTDPPDAAYPSTCASESAQADVAYCSSLGTFNFANGRCDCDSSQHVTDADCSERHCSAHGSSVVSGTGNNPVSLRCSCLPGWSGANCASCASSPDVTLEYLCVGLVMENVPLALRAHTHVLTLVEDTSVLSRLSGAYYSTDIIKHADVLPGVSLHDCWCLTTATRISQYAHESHGDAADAASAYLTLESRLRALAFPSEASATSPTPAPVNPTQRPTPRPTAQPTPAPNTGISAGLHRGLVVLLIVYFVI